MKRFSTIALLLLLTYWITPTYGQQVFKTTSASVIGYLEYLPADYNNNSNKYPVVIFLHGIGERGTNTTDRAILETSIQSVDNLGPPKYAKEGTSFPFILISPQLKNNYSTWPSSYVMEVIEHVKTYLRIDERQIHVTGLSLGGGGAWVAAQDETQTFASVAAICGGYNSPSKACLLSAENLPVWAFHGDVDTIVPLSRSVNMVNAINACLPAPNPLAKMTIYEGVAHDAWARAYKPDHTYHNPNVYEWMMSFTNIKNGGNNIPIANAGADKTIGANSGVTLTGSATDANGSISTYRWTKMSGPSATLSGTTSQSLTASALTSGTYIFRLQVTDNGGATDSDYVKVTVTNTTPPVANAGTDRLISLPSNTITLNGSGSDADGTISTYAWSKISGGSATLTNANSTSLVASNLAAGSYVFRLTVIDNGGASSYDDVTVVVNNPPAVSVGADLKITLPNNSVSIQGTASDTDGTIASYAWTMTTGTVATLTGTNTSKLTATGLIEGSYVFRLLVKDNTGASKFDDIKIVVLAGTNTAPIANAGADKVISLPANSVTISGSGSDSDGTISSYAWTKISGGNATLTNQNTSTLNVSELAAGSYVFRLTVADNTGASHTDDVSVLVNNQPIVSAGSDFSITLPTNSVTVNGLVSDTDGTISSYQWTMTTGTIATLSGTTTPTLNATGLVAGSYVFRLTAKDNYGASKFDDIKITVLSTTSSSSIATNIAPVSNAGTDKVITLPTNSTTIAGAGTDSDGTISTYTWTKISGGTSTLANASTSTLSVSGLGSGTYVFRLTVKDNSGATAYDDMKLTVNIAPTVNAGPNATITLPANSLTIYGSAADADGTIQSYSWAKWSGGAATLSGATTPTLTVTGLAAGTYIFRLSAKDNSGSSRYDEMTVTVNATTSFSSVEERIVSEDESASTDLRNDDVNFWKNKVVVIFDASGKEIFHGKWSVENFESIPSRELLVVNILSEGKKVLQQKIIKQ
jgi:dienelactone hydrolase